MKKIAVVAIAQLFLLVAGNDVPGERKRVGCFYLGVKSERYGTVEPEDIDTSICTHVVYLNGAINNETEKIEIKSISPTWKTLEGESVVPRLAKLKAKNPDLKLILHVFQSPFYWILMNSSRKANVIRNGVEWLAANGFDGLDLPLVLVSPDTEDVADHICDLKSELDKRGLILTTMIMDYLLPGPSQAQRDSFSKLARCCDGITLTTLALPGVTNRLSSMNKTKSNVEGFLERGLPANKTQITISPAGYTAILKDKDETGIGANISGPGNDDLDLGDGFFFHYKELLRKLNDSSLGWTFRRDNETKEPYAFTTAGLWISYEDAASIEFKARYVMEKGLGGIDIIITEMEDDEGIGGEGRFPLARKISDTFGGRSHPLTP